MVDKLFFEDFVVGQRFRSAARQVTAEEIKAFAAQFDPQPFHLDEAAAQATFFKGLAASGWHTAAITMRLLVDGGMPIAGGIIGAGMDEMRWPRALRPGDVACVESEVIEVRSSDSRPGFGWLKVKSQTLNQDGQAVQVTVANLLAPRRAA